MVKRWNGRKVWLDDYLRIPIPEKFSSSRDKFDAETNVIHYTGGGNGLATARWAAEGVGRSWHFLITRKGKVIQQVALDRACWHAGKSEWLRKGEMWSGVNLWSIGIELANYGHRPYPTDDSPTGYAVKLGNVAQIYRHLPPVKARLLWDSSLVRSVEAWWEPYPPSQIIGLKNLLYRLALEGYTTDRVGHEEIAMPLGRKTDPGPLFPWEQVSRIHADRRTSGVRLSG